MFDETHIRLVEIMGFEIDVFPEGNMLLIENNDIFVARTGYTGEDGVEIIFKSEFGYKIWELLINNGVTPCGLGARDLLRIEAGLHLYLSLIHI